MKKTEIKLDQSTLPADGLWVECETYEHCEIVAKYCAEEKAFFSIDKKPSLLISAFDVHFWEPLGITWGKPKKVSPDPYDGRYEYRGVDRFGNEFKGIGLAPSEMGQLIRNIKSTNNKISVSTNN